MCHNSQINKIGHYKREFHVKIMSQPLPNIFYHGIQQEWYFMTATAQLPRAHSMSAVAHAKHVFKMVCC